MSVGKALDRDDLVLVLDALGIGIIGIEHGRVIVASATTARLVKSEVSDVTGSPLIDWISPEHRTVIADRADQDRAGAKVSAHSLSLLAADGERVAVDVAVTAGQDPHVGLLIDRRALHRSEAERVRLVTLLDHLPVAIVVWDTVDREDPQAMRLSFANRTATALFGFELEPFLGRRFDEVPLPLPSSDAARAHAVALDGGTDVLPDLAVEIQGVERLFRRTAIGLGGGSVVVRVEDVAREWRAERQRVALLRRMIEVGDDERRALANELHDDVVQHLAASAILIDGVRRRGSDRDVTARLDEAGESLREAVAKIRRVLNGLSPPELEHSGIATAVRTAAANALAGSTIDASIEVVVDDSMPTILQHAVLRIVSESLLNAGRHASATRVQVEVRQDADQVTIRVLDDGVGVPATPPTGHYGLRSIAERACALGGSSTIERGGPLGGTAVFATLPLAVPPAPDVPTPESLAVPIGEVQAMKAEIVSLTACLEASRNDLAAERRRLTSAAELTKRLSETASAPEALAVASWGLSRLFGATVTIRVLTPDRTELVLGAHEVVGAGSAASPERPRIAVGASTEGLAVRYERSIIVADGTKRVATDASRAKAVLPLEASGVCGTLTLSGWAPSSDEELGFAECIASQIAHALRRTGGSGHRSD